LKGLDVATSQPPHTYCELNVPAKYLGLTQNRPTILGIFCQLKGIGYIAPIYYFLHYIQSPLENYHAADNRLTQIGPVKTIIPTLLFSYILPSIAMFGTPDLASRQWINGLFW
jgi:hypothetical protein